MPLPPGHHESRARSLNGRERRLARAAAALAAALLVAVVVLSVAARGARSADGCVHATYAGPVGAGSIDACGGQARSLCSSLGVHATGFSRDAAQSIGASCRSAGLPVGRGA